MGLMKAVQGALTVRHAPETSNTALATVNMGNSVNALQAIAVGGRQNSETLVKTTQVIGGKRLNQNQVTEMVHKLGRVVADEKELARLVPVVVEAAKAHEKAEAHRGKMAKAIGGAMQKVAVANSATQRELFNGHADAQVTVALNQSAYSGANFGV
jgi:hypothetical protein